jgi:hypothetical protein
LLVIEPVGLKAHLRQKGYGTMVVQSTRQDHDGRQAARVFALASVILFSIIFVLHAITF